MAAEAETSIKLDCVHGKPETFGTTRGVCGLVWCRGKEMRAVEIPSVVGIHGGRAREQGLVLTSPKDLSTPVIRGCGASAGVDTCDGRLGLHALE